MQSVQEAINTLDNYGLQGSACDGICEAWQTLKSFVLAQLSHNKPSAQVCPHARLKWSVYDCTIKDSFALDLMDCNGEGTYSIPGNNGFGYSHQCNKVPGKPAHVG
ncbi:MAG: hypothetical protein PHN44_00005 [Candidatus Marinimicrobia bacterium]|nr:hypothetical protein [Candidatus Neomarinimicrobiota bacterium]